MLSLLLLQHALAPGVIDAHARSRLPAPRSNDSPPSRPYLKVAAIAPPLRFNSPPPPPDLTSKPAAGAPPLPMETSAEPIANPVSPGQIPAVASLAPSPVPPVAAPAEQKTPVAATPPPTAILPDDTRPSVRAEDFLPFFQFPTAGGNVNVVVPASVPTAPAPGPLPPSSATYQQR